MSQNTMVIYLKNPKIKTWLAAKAKKATQKTGSLKSVSSLVVDILEEEYRQEKSENPLVKYHGTGKSISPSDWEAVEKSMQEFKSSFKLESDKNL